MNKQGQILKLTLGSKKILEKDDKKHPLEKLKIQKKGPKLTSEQETAKNFIFKEINQSKFSTIVIDGVAGSGKTEVYFEAICRVLEKKKQVLFSIFLKLLKICSTTKNPRKKFRRFAAIITQVSLHK